MNYEKPEASLIEKVSEGVYLSSGMQETGGTETGSQTRCKSQYMKGNFQPKRGDSINIGYKDGYGCEGCPAYRGDSCAFDTAPEQMNYDGDFRPSWETWGKLPDEKGY